MSNIENPMIIYGGGTVEVGPGKGPGNNGLPLTTIITDHHGSNYRPADETEWFNFYNSGRKPLDEQYKTAQKVWPKGPERSGFRCSSIGPSDKISESQRLDNTSKAIQSMIGQNAKDLKANEAILAKCPGVDFKTSTVKDFQRRFSENKIPYDEAFYLMLDQELTAIAAAYNSDILKEAIKI
ncbi:TPA: hypothetical protein ACXJQH_005939 [Pseudomonas aeruginosa]